MPAIVVITPVANPDGFAENVRHNANGVDLNRNFPASNFDAEVKTVYTLKARKGDAATVEGKTTIKGGAQQIEEGGMAITVETIKGRGTAALDVTLAGLVATGTLTQDVAIAMKVNDQAFETKSSTKMTTAAKPLAAAAQP